MRILVTGKEGQIARCLADRADAHPAFDIVFAARGATAISLDLADPATVRAAVNTTRPDLILSVAAYTAVDQAEDEPELAMAVNGTAPGILAAAARANGARIIHISTDYVFDGNLERAYVESDAVNPLGVYGRTKLAGEAAVRATNPDHLILRTAWVYSPYGKNFKKTMLRLAEGRDTVAVVDDQIGTPTSAHDIADALLAIAECWKSGRDTGLGEVFHFAGPEAMTWCGFARQIFTESAAAGGPSATVTPITSADYPTRAARPKNSRLDRTAFETAFAVDLKKARAAS